jgi:hypothetical protein
MANTVIQLKWSEVTATPVTLNVAEPAYSNSSGKLFIGDANQNPVVVGGKYYTDIIDAATAANTYSTIVKRDSSGNFSATTVTANLYGNANTATQLQTPRWFNFTGDVDAQAVSFNGTANADFTLELTNTGVTNGTYGGTTKIPTFAVDVDGRITSAANVDVQTYLAIAGDSGTDTVNILTGTLTFEGGDGITSTVTNDKASFAVDGTVVRTSGSQSIDGNLAVTGNLVVSGNTVTQDVETLIVEDSLIQFAANNAADALDIGFFGQYNDGSTKYTTFFRDASDSGKFKLLTGGTTKPSAANTVDTTSFSTATLVANLTGGTVSGLTSDIAIADGGTNASSFPTGNLVFFNGTSLAGIANTGTAGTYGAADRTQVITTDDYGRVSGITNTAISIAASQITSGNVAINRGGTNNDGGSYITGGILQYDGTKITGLANTGTSGTYANASHVPVITTDPYGRVSAITNTAIAIDTTQVTSGTLGVVRGGTGASSFSVKGVIVSDSSSGTGALTALTSSTEGHVLQINSSGVPTFAHLNGGSF